MHSANAAVQTLSTLLDGAEFATAIRSNGKPCRIALPADREGRESLICSHLRGAPATLTFIARGHDPWRETVDAVALAAFCPAADGQCRFVALDVDAADHGPAGLADPAHVVRTIAERADALGLLSGLVAARSRGGQGRHIFFLVTEPVPLQHAVIGVAALGAAAWKVAKLDSLEYETPPAFRCANGAAARLGDAGAVELLPRSGLRPQFGWAMTLPAAGAFAARGGGAIIDPFTDAPCDLTSVPVCDTLAWARLIADAMNELTRAVQWQRWDGAHRAPSRSTTCSDPLTRIDHRTRELIDGQTPTGSRNNAAFAAGANLLGCGVNELEARRLVLAGGRACGLSEREARTAFESARRAHARQRDR